MTHFLKDCINTNTRGHAELCPKANEISRFNEFITISKIGKACERRGVMLCLVHSSYLCDVGILLICADDDPGGPGTK